MFAHNTTYLHQCLNLHICVAVTLCSTAQQKCLHSLGHSTALLEVCSNAISTPPSPWQTWRERSPSVPGQCFCTSPDTPLLRWFQWLYCPLPSSAGCQTWDHTVLWEHAAWQVHGQALRYRGHSGCVPPLLRAPPAPVPPKEQPNRFQWGCLQH